MDSSNNKEEQLNTKIFPTWCAGCGDFGIWAGLKGALNQVNVPRERVVIVYGIGCSGNMASFVSMYGVHGLHGRAIPVAEGIKAANHKLKVIVVAGDGDLLGEGMNHFVTASRMNSDITVILHNNQMYSLTTGQSSPTSLMGTKGKATPEGVMDKPVNPVGLSLLMGGSHVMRGFSGDIAHMTGLIKSGIEHEGFSFIDVLQPCVTFNKLNTYEWFRQRIMKLDKPYRFLYDAIVESEWNEDRILIGEFYKDMERKAWPERLSELKEETLIQGMQGEVDLAAELNKLK